MYIPSMPNPFFTVGHSTRPIEEFVALLTNAEVELVVDVRTVPRSRTNPQFNRDALPASLAAQGIAYEHFGVLGGLRGKQPGVNSDVNAFWKNASFHKCRLRAERGVPLRTPKLTRAWTQNALNRHVRGKPLVAMPSPDHCGSSPRCGRGGLPHPWPWPRGASPFDARSAGRARWRTDLSEGLSAHARPPAMNRTHDQWRASVSAARTMPQVAGGRK
jgi:hypothetical protein